MQFDIITIFAEFFAGPFDYGIVRRAREARLVGLQVHDLRAFTHDRHHTVDDRPFGGGEGMVLKPEPLFEAVDSLLGEAVPTRESGDPGKGGTSSGSDAARQPAEFPAGDVGGPSGTAVVLLSASGKLFRQDTARRFSQLGRIILICGRYEGVDERVAEHLATDELSIGDYVLSGGELGAALIVDAVTRLLPGALGNEDSSVNESFSATASSAIAPPHASSAQLSASPPSMGFMASQSPFDGTHGKPVTPRTHPGQASHLLLDFPHYTRPAEFRGWPVPEVLLGGNHEEIRRWRQEKALEKTRRNRPDLLGDNSPDCE